MGRHLSILILISLVLMPFMGVIGTQSTPTASNEDFIVSDVVDFERGPTVNLVTNNSATIFWRTDALTDATVDYGLNTSILESESNATLDTDHFIKLTGLDDNTKYFYRVESSGDQSEIYHFITAPLDNEEFHLIIAGDNRPDSSSAPVQPEVFSTLIDMMIDEEPHIVVLTGDFVYRLGENDAENLAAWKALTDITDRIGHYAPVIGIIGNHDTGVSSGVYRPEYYLDAFVNTNEKKTYFSFDYAGVHFIGLDSEEYQLEGHITGDQYNWFVQDLADSANQMKFVFAHRPLYSTTHIGSSLDVDLEERDALSQLLIDNNVTLFASGHDHAYSWVVVNGVTHLISGGLGAPPYTSTFSQAIYHYTNVTVNPHRVSFSAVRDSGSIADEFSIPLEGPIHIFLREVANYSSQRAGTIPTILFSEEPETVFYSWDLGANSSTLTGIPGTSSMHILNVYAEDDEGAWSSMRYVFRTAGFEEPTDTTTPTTTTTSPPPSESAFDFVLIAGIIGIAAIVLVVGAVFKLRRG